MRKRDESEEFPGIFRYADADGTEHVLDIKLRVRGNFRARKENCNFAPIRVNFKKGQVEGTVFAGQDKIKLVTDCQSSRSKYQQLLLKEYLAYKILNVMSDRSFGARLLRVTYVDTDNERKSRESYAFFIEDKDHIGDRLGLERVMIPETSYSALNAAHANMINVYQYLIANTDFSLIAGPSDNECCHNIVLYQNESDPYITIPYDFDHAGLVDAPYAKPNPQLRIRSVRSRVYRGRCSNNSHLESTLSLFIERRDDVGQLVRGLDGFDEKSVNETMKFIDRFYEEITTPKTVQNKFVKQCS